MTDKIRDLSIESSGENSGAMFGVNSGPVTINKGMQYPEVRALCLDLISDELKIYRDTALKLAKHREEQLFSKFVEKLAQADLKEEMVQKAFETPEMQIDCIEAEKAYIRSGTPELENILSNILVRRVQESERKLLQITLSEAIRVSPMLLPSQMASLALCFVLKHTKRLDFKNEKDFILYCTKTIIPIYTKGCQKKSEFQHLSYTGCSQTTAITYNLSKAFKGKYKGLFSKGFNEEDIPNDSNDFQLKNKYPQMFIPCITDNSKWQICVMDEKILQEQFKEYDVDITDQSLFLDLFNKQQMSKDETREQICIWVPDMKKVFEYWETNYIESLQLSSVGIVIGAFYAQSITDEKYDLNIWI